MVTDELYIPDRGDIVWISFDPHSGREQAGRRPALVLSPKIYNERSSLMLVCPITSAVKGYPFEVPLPSGMSTRGVVLADQIKSLDWLAREASYQERVPAPVERLAADLVQALLGF